jgi:hypothetical protein
LSGTLNSPSSINNILNKVIARVTVTHVDIVEPSLEQVFIDQVKRRMDS